MNHFATGAVTAPATREGARLHCAHNAAVRLATAALMLGLWSAVASAQTTTFAPTTVAVNGALSVTMKAPAGVSTSLVAGGGGGVSVLANDGAGHFSTIESRPDAPAPSLPGVGIGDVNGDGHDDIVTIGRILWGQAGGAHGAVQAFTPPNLGGSTSTGALAVGDVNADGYADIAFSIYSPGLGGVALWLGGPGAPGSWTPAAVASQTAGFAPFSVAIADLNGDPFNDVIVANGSSNSITVYLGAGGSPYLTDRAYYSTFAGGYPTPDNLATGDVNGDGFVDVLAVGRGPSSVSTFLNDGDGNFAAPIVSSVGPLGTWGSGSSWDSRAIGIADFDSDGVADIVVPIPWNLATGPFSRVAILYGDGSGAFGSEQDFAIGNSPVSVVTGDFNGDGLADFAIGNSGANTVTVMLNTSTPPDRTAPAASPTRTPPPNTSGWNNTDVTITWNWVDVGGSGIDLDRCTLASTSTGEGVSVPLAATCLDEAGNTGHASDSVKVDKTRPTISAVATTSPNAAGWYQGDVTIRFTCSDALSGIPAGACPPDQVLTTEGSAVASTPMTVTDAAGNTSDSSNVVVVQIDKTKPTLAPAVSPNPVLLHGSATATPGAADPLSGVATASCTALNASSAGAKSVTCTASDRAGNTSSADAIYAVHYLWAGFFQPVDNLPTLNQVKAGRAVPIKFSLGGDQGLGILAPGFPASRLVACATGAPIDDLEETIAAGGSSLSYSPTTGQYTYVWKTSSNWVGQCRQLTVTLVDGTEHHASFTFK